MRTAHWSRPRNIRPHSSGFARYNNSWYLYGFVCVQRRINSVLQWNAKHSSRSSKPPRPSSSCPRSISTALASERLEKNPVAWNDRLPHLSGYKPHSPRDTTQKSLGSPHRSSQLTSIKPNQEPIIARESSGITRATSNIKRERWVF